MISDLAPCAACPIQHDATPIATIIPIGCRPIWDEYEFAGSRKSISFDSVISERLLLPQTTIAGNGRQGTRSTEKMDGGVSALGSGASPLTAGASALSGVVRTAIPAQRGQLARIGDRAAAQQRLAPAQFDAILLEFCAVVPLSRAEIAILTGRSQGWVSRRVSALVRDGRLRLLYPEIATHPAQRYLAPERES